MYSRWKRAKERMWKRVFASTWGKKKNKKTNVKNNLVKKKLTFLFSLSQNYVQNEVLNKKPEESSLTVWRTQEILTSGEDNALRNLDFRPKLVPWPKSLNFSEFTSSSWKSELDKNNDVWGQVILKNNFPIISTE